MDDTEATELSKLENVLFKLATSDTDEQVPTSHTCKL